MLPAEPEQFKELCEKVGLALMMGQKVQFALAHYYSLFHIMNSGWSKARAKKKIGSHLSNTMGFVVNSIQTDASLEQPLFDAIIKFKSNRNWLAHDFDEESTPYLSQNQKFDYYIEKMDEIVKQAYMIMLDLDKVGEKLVPVSI